MQEDKSTVEIGEKKCIFSIERVPKEFFNGNPEDKKYKY